jgi:hypothetical protein
MGMIGLGNLKVVKPIGELGTEEAVLVASRVTVKPSGPGSS